MQRSCTFCCQGRERAVVRYNTTGRFAGTSGTLVPSSSRYGTAGQIVDDLQSVQLSKNDPRLLAVKGCIDKAAAETLPQQPAAHFIRCCQQHSKESAQVAVDADESISSYWVRLLPGDLSATAAISQKQRKKFSEQIQQQFNASHCQLSYLTHMQPNEAAMQLWAGSDTQGALPDIWIMFEPGGQQSDQQQLSRPCNAHIGGCHIIQQVVKYIQYLPFMKQHLSSPKASALEKLVTKLQSQLGHTRTGSRGFDQLLQAALGEIAGSQLGLTTDGMGELLQDARLATRAWGAAAQSLLDDYQQGHGWVRPVLWVEDVIKH